MKIFLKFLLVFFGIPLAAFSQSITPPPDIVFTMTNQTINRDTFAYSDKIAEGWDLGELRYSGITCPITQTTSIVGGELVPGYPKTYKTNVPGVGIIFSNTKGHQGWYEDAPSTNSLGLTLAAGAVQQWRQAKLVAVGPVSAGTITSAPYMMVTYTGTCIKTVTSKVSIALNTTKVTAGTCTVTSKQVNVPLPDIKVSDLPSVNSTAGNTDFVLALSCPSSTNLYITFTDKNNLANRSNILSLNSSGGNSASGLGVQVLRETTPVSFGPDSSAKGTENQILLASNITNRSITVKFSARYIATAVPVGAGSVSATATFTMSYQ